MAAATAGSPSRAPRLTRERLAGTARALLVQGGTDAVVVREVARSLEVAPSALYKHVDGRDGLLTLLIAQLYDELADAVTEALDDAPPEAHRARLAAATDGVRSWARRHPSEFDLLFGFPVHGYRAPEKGPTTAAAQRFGGVFLGVFAAARDAGRLRVRDDASLPGEVVDQFRRRPGDGPFARLTPGELYPVVVGYQRMLGLVMIEVTGQLSWALDDPSRLTDEQLDRLADELLTPGP
jgi:AcrR family transcriptional regulator